MGCFAFVDTALGHLPWVGHIPEAATDEYAAWAVRLAHEKDQSSIGTIAFRHELVTDSVGRCL